MKALLAVIFTLTTFNAWSQCEVLDFIEDTADFEGVLIRYYQVDSRVQIQYEYGDYINQLGDEYSFSCDVIYQPGIPRPIWRNENYICFHSSCGTSCFSNYLAPLNDQYQAEHGGQFLLDTTNIIFMSLLHDSLTNHPYLELKNYTTGKNQIERFTFDDFPVAIPIEYLDYSHLHENGFTYKNKELTLYLKGNRKIKVKVKV